MSAAVHVFCGPTITADEVVLIVPHAQVHPPVRHGDLLRLDLGPGDTVVVIDGLFHQIAPVRHKEILHLLARGVVVVGSSSMGALRAAELHTFGMIGVGEIFAAYRDGVIEADDEVAMTYSLDDYRQLSEALADMRATLRLAVADGVLDDGQADRLVEHARRLPYASRSWPTLRRVVTTSAPELEGVLDDLAAWHAGASVPSSAKHRDAQEALRLVASDNPGEEVPFAWASSSWRTHHLREWIARSRGPQADGTQVPFLDLLHYQQLYDQDFARRWRRHVMSFIAGAGSVDPEPDAVAVMAAGGISIQNLSPPQLAYWLTDAEVTGLSDPEKLARLVVRSVPGDRTAPVRPATVEEAGDLLIDIAGTASAVAAALRRNAEIASAAPHQTIYHLRVSQLRRHLAGKWSVDLGDEPALGAAARDRGFAGLAEAVNAARTFFLTAVRFGVSSGTVHGTVGSRQR